MKKFLLFSFMVTGLFSYQPTEVTATESNTADVKEKFLIEEFTGEGRFSVNDVNCLVSLEKGFMKWTLLDKDDQVMTILCEGNLSEVLEDKFDFEFTAIYMNDKDLYPVDETLEDIWKRYTRTDYTAYLVNELGESQEEAENRTNHYFEGPSLPYLISEDGSTVTLDQGGRLECLLVSSQSGQKE